MKKIAFQILVKLDPISSVVRADKWEAARTALTQFDLYVLCEILRCVLGGQDARVPLGITPRRGRPKAKNYAIAHEVMAAYYLKRRKTEPLEKKVAAEVAGYWGISQRYVRECARNYRARHASLSKSEMARQIAWDAAFASELIGR
jgi:hypothetical protein